MINKSKPLIAFIGLGHMGTPMALRLARAGYRLRVFDRSPAARSQWKTDDYIAACATPAEAAHRAQVLITMLPDGRAVSTALLGGNGAAEGLAAGATVIDMSSCDPADTKHLAAALAARGIQLLDAPVSGRVDGARAGTLAIMVGGDARALARVRPILECLGSQIFHVGPSAAGHVVKALNNYIAAAGTVAACEAFIIGRRFGLDPRTLIEVWNASAGRNSTTQNKLEQHILSGTFASGFSLGLMAKDVGIAAGLARNLKITAPSVQAQLKLWRAAERELLGTADHTRMYAYLESLQGKVKPNAKRGAKPGATSARPAKSSPARRT